MTLTEDLRAIRERAEKAGEHPCTIRARANVAKGIPRENAWPVAQFLNHARTDVPRLVAALEAALGKAKCTCDSVPPYGGEICTGCKVWYAVEEAWASKK